MGTLTGKPFSGKNAKFKHIDRVCIMCNKHYLGENFLNICPDCCEKFNIGQTEKTSYGCNKRKICKKCAHRVRISGSSTKGDYICFCLDHTGEIRDLTADDNHCATFEAKGVNHYDDEDDLPDLP